MPVRKRISTSLMAGGDFDFSPRAYNPTTTISEESVCEDVTGTKTDCEPFTVEKSTMSGGRINTANSGSGVWFKDYTCGWIRGRDAYGRSHLTSVDPKTDGEYATQLRQRTNPSRPSVDMGVNLLDIEHIPRAARSEAKRLSQFASHLKVGSEAFLAYQFMIAPLLSDLWKMTNLTDAVNRRVKELERLRSRGLRRTIDLDRFGYVNTVSGTLVQSVGLGISADLSKETVCRVRGHARWGGGELFANTPEDRLSAAREALTGLVIDPATAWELIPWSWFDDWFGNIGDYLISRRNVIDADLLVSVIMRDTRSRVLSSHHNYYGQSVTMTPIVCDYRTKTRVPVSGTVEFHLPILTSGQVGILGSIGVLSRL